MEKALEEDDLDKFNRYERLIIMRDEWAQHNQNYTAVQQDMIDRYERILIRYNVRAQRNELALHDCGYTATQRDMIGRYERLLSRHNERALHDCGYIAMRREDWQKFRSRNQNNETIISKKYFNEEDRSGIRYYQNGEPMLRIITKEEPTQRNTGNTNNDIFRGTASSKNTYRRRARDTKLQKLNKDECSDSKFEGRNNERSSVKEDAQAVVPHGMVTERSDNNDDLIVKEDTEHGEHSEGRPAEMISDLDENVHTLQELRDRLDKVDPPPPEQEKARIEAEKVAAAEEKAWIEAEKAAVAERRNKGRGEHDVEKRYEHDIVEGSSLIRYDRTTKPRKEVMKKLTNIVERYGDVLLNQRPEIKPKIACS